ncbi:unnamed protein product, partial [Phaeothamnion confervicola]
MNADVFAAALAHVCVSYNVLVVSLALSCANEVHPYSDIESTMVTSALVGGSIVGMTFFGWLGDATTRKGALAWAMFVAFVGAASSAVLSFEPYLYLQLAIWRLVVGFGCGGLYPLAATIARESPGATPRTVATTICAQGIGYFFAPVTAYALLCLVDSYAVIWRTLLGIGAILLLVPLPLILRNNGARDSCAQPEAAERKARPSLVAALRQRSNWPLLAGTAGCWFLFDIVFYGNTLFEDVVLADMFPNDGGVKDTAMEEVITYAIAIWGYFAGFAFMDRLGPRFIQTQGFSIMAILYLLLWWIYSDTGSSSFLLLVPYACTYLFSNFGPNVTTFIIPSLTYPMENRASLNGISAAAGKAGALVGSLAFEPLSSSVGVSGIFFICGLIAATAAIATVTFV